MVMCHVHRCSVTYTLYTIVTHVHFSEGMSSTVKLFIILFHVIFRIVLCFFTDLFILFQISLCVPSSHGIQFYPGLGHLEGKILGTTLLTALYLASGPGSNWGSQHSCQGDERAITDL